MSAEQRSTAAWARFPATPRRRLTARAHRCPTDRQRPADAPASSHQLGACTTSTACKEPTETRTALHRTRPDLSPKCVQGSCVGNRNRFCLVVRNRDQSCEVLWLGHKDFLSHSENLQWKKNWKQKWNQTKLWKQEISLRSLYRWP